MNFGLEHFSVVSATETCYTIEAVDVKLIICSKLFEAKQVRGKRH